MVWFMIGFSAGSILGAGVIFLFASAKICDLARKCPLCQAVDQNEKLRRKVEDLEFGLLVSDTEMLLNFDEAGEGKIFSCVGQA